MGTLHNPHDIQTAIRLREATGGAQIPVEVNLLVMKLIGKDVEVDDVLSEVVYPDEYCYFCGVCGYQMIGISPGGECPVCGAVYVIPRCKTCGEYVLLPLWRPCLHYMQYGLSVIDFTGHKVGINTKVIMGFIVPVLNPIAFIKSLRCGEPEVRVL